MRIFGLLTSMEQNLGGAHLEGARITLKGQEEGGFETAGASLNYAELWGLTLPDVDLQSADMRASYLHGTDFRGGDLRKAQLFGAWIRVMNLEGADLREAELVAVDGELVATGMSPLSTFSASMPARLTGSFAAPKCTA